MKKPLHITHHASLVTLLLAAIPFGMFAADFSHTALKGRTDKPNPVGYAVGEPIVFTVTSTNLPADVAGCAFDWKRTGDDGVVETGRVAVSSAPLVVKTTLAKPGFVRLEVTIRNADGKPAKGKDAFFDGGAGAGADTLAQGEPEPADFDSFWARQLRRLADVPMVAHRKEIPCKNEKVTLYEVEVDCAGPRPVTGYLCIPKQATAEKPMMAHLQFCGYGANPPGPAGACTDRVHFLVNAHGVSLGRDKAYYDNFLDGIRTKGYSYAFSPYQNEYPEGSYLCGMALRAIRAAQYLFSLPEVKGKPHWICGSSQGGLQTMWVAAFDTGATVAFPHVTWNCDLGGYKVGRIQAPWHIPSDPALGYFDAVNFAKRAKVPVHIQRAGLGDYTCPPSGLAVCYNALKVDKSIEWVQGSQHCYVPSKPNQTATLKAKAMPDVVVYGGTAAGVTAAIAAKRAGADVVLVSQSVRLGGMTTGGLGQTDIAHKEAYGGLAREFYRRIRRHYQDDAAWTQEKRRDYLPDGQVAALVGGDADAMWTFEPSVAQKVIDDWVKEENIEVVRGERLAREKVTVEGDGEQRRIVSFVAESGKVYAGRTFIDATYEGDLMAAAGVSFVVGREANAEFGETINGVERRLATSHQLRRGIDPYVVPGNPSSGLLPGVEKDDARQDGAGDGRVQAYCFRMCLTDAPGNRIPFAKPAGYDEREYELLFRNFAAGEGADGKLPWINSRMPNRKTDTNNRTGFSTDFVGHSADWPTGSYAEREKIFREHLTYQQGLMWTLANHPRVPESVRREISRWGVCRDEFVENGGWPTELYVREGRRMRGEYVMTEHNCRGTRIAPRPIACGSYGMDSHNCRRYVTKEGDVQNEGNVEDWSSADRTYAIDYGAIVPKRGEASNLLVPVALSATHMAFGSIRMEPAFMALGAAAGRAAALAANDSAPVQDVDYAKLKALLSADGQTL